MNKRQIARHVTLVIAAGYDGMHLVKVYKTTDMRFTDVLYRSPMCERFEKAMQYAKDWCGEKRYHVAESYIVGV